jgi:cyclophilin family peptidyl-prolyl cis-trans isomerase
MTLCTGQKLTEGTESVIIKELKGINRTMNKLFCLLLLATVIGACKINMNRNAKSTGDADLDEAAKYMVIETAKGVIKIELFKGSAHLSVENIVKLLSKRYYDGLTFHRVEPGRFVVGGDPLGTGAGGPGYSISQEIDKELTVSAGTVAMARLPNYVNPNKESHGSQFFISLARLEQLDGGYTIFGQVAEGMDVVQHLAPGDIMTKVYVSGK